MSGELEADNLGPWGLACGEGKFPGADCSPTTGQPTQANKVERGAEQADIREGPRTGAEGSSHGSEPAARPVYQSHLPGLQEGRITQTRGKLETTEPFCGKVQVQDGRGKDTERPDQEERLDHLHQSHGGLERDRKYLRFVWEDKMYEFPFGLCSAP